LTEPASGAAEAAARRSYGKLVAFLAARTRDVAGAEDALADAFATALADWPRKGVPDNPEAWLLTVARRRMVDAVRGRIRAEEAAAGIALLDGIGHGLPEDDEPLPDRRLELLFACAHPGIDAAAHAPLMLQVVLGFDAAAIASSFLVAPSAMGQRLVRAKAKIRNAGIPFEVPPHAQMAERLDSVLVAIYAAFAEGWTDALNADARRRNLVEEALWMGRLLAALMPQEPEALGLLALMLHAHARRRARRDEAGGYVPLASQDTARWDHAMIDEAESLLQQAAQLGRPGRFQLEAAVQSAHSVRRNGAAADWDAIVGLYTALHAMTGSPLAALNRAVARAQAGDVAAGFAELDALQVDARLAEYQPYWAARADLLARLGRSDEAVAAYRRAIGLERDDAVRRFLQERAEGLSLRA
jgi:RNA polymerase sigma-70 factor (ECF subfamily)